MRLAPILSLGGGLALHPPTDAVLDTTVYCMPMQSHYYLPLIDYKRSVLHSQVSTGEYVSGGQTLATGIVAPTSGKITGIFQHPWPHPSQTEVATLVLEADGQDDRLRLDPITPEKHTLEETLDRIERAGVHGLGGAAFSTSKKIRRVLKHNSRSLIINAVECEPGIACDDVLMQNDPEGILLACQSLCDCLSIHTALFAIEDNKKDALHVIENLSNAIAPSLKIAKLPTIYPSGAERPLVERLTGVSIGAKNRAADLGILCINVATVLAICRALQGGSAIDRIVSITTQDLKHTVNVKVRFGTPIKQVLQFAKTLNPVISSAIDTNTDTVTIGGPLSGFEKNIDNSPILATCNALLVGPTKPVKTASTCIRCSECATVCPVNLLPQELYAAAAANDFNTVARYSLDECLLCGCCDLVCPANIPLTPWFKFAKDSINHKHQEAQAAELAKERSEKHSTREQLRAKQKSEQTALQRNTSAVRQTSAHDIKAALARVKKKRPSS